MEWSGSECESLGEVVREEGRKEDGFLVNCIMDKAKFGVLRSRKVEGEKGEGGKVGGSSKSEVVVRSLMRCGSTELAITIYVPT